jgi:hypothetical protein
VKLTSNCDFSKLTLELSTKISVRLKASPCEEKAKLQIRGIQNMEIKMSKAFHSMKQLSTVMAICLIVHVLKGGIENFWVK